MSIHVNKMPLKEITEFHGEGNVYEMTNATIHRAGQLTITGGEIVEQCENKVVTAALVEVLNKKVLYKVVNN